MGLVDEALGFVHADGAPGPEPSDDLASGPTVGNPEQEDLAQRGGSPADPLQRQVERLCAFTQLLGILVGDDKFRVM